MVAERLDPIRVQSDSRDHSVSPDAALSSAAQLHRRTVRKLWLTFHVYMGLFAGGLFVLSSLTGSLLVFYKTIDEWLNPEQLLVRPLEHVQPLERIVENARAIHPELPGLDNLTFPLYDRDTFQAWFRVQTGTREQFHWQMVTVDPYSGHVMSERQWGTYFVSFIYELHKSLLLGDTGETVVGILAFLLMLSVGTGLYLWWPSPGKLRRAFSFKSGSSVIRRHYDLHKLSGLSSALILLLLAFTGFYLEFPSAVVPIVKLFSPVRDAPEEWELHSTVLAGIDALPVDQAVAIAQEALPDARVMWLGFPSGAEGVYSVGLRQPGEVREAEGQSQVWIDQYSGAVLSVQDWRRFTRGETFVAWLFPLHNGEAFGLTGRWIILITGFIPSILYVTALRMWWLKRNARLRQRYGEQRVQVARAALP